jgi:hypothetical protein
MSITDIQMYRPHYTLEGDGKVYVLPVSFVDDIVSGCTKISEIPEESHEVIRLILADWQSTVE